MNEKRTSSQKPPRDPRSQLNNAEKPPRVDSVHSSDQYNYDRERNIARTNISPSIRKLGHQYFRQMVGDSLAMASDQENITYNNVFNQEQVNEINDEEAAWGI